MEDELNSPLPQSKDANVSSKRLKISGLFMEPKWLHWFHILLKYFIIKFCFNDNLPNTNTVFSSIKQLQNWIIICTIKWLDLSCINNNFLRLWLINLSVTNTSFKYFCFQLLLLEFSKKLPALPAQTQVKSYCIKAVWGTIHVLTFGTGLSPCLLISWGHI